MLSVKLTSGVLDYTEKLYTDVLYYNLNKVCENLHCKRIHVKLLKFNSSRSLLKVFQIIIRCIKFLFRYIQQPKKFLAKEFSSGASKKAFIIISSTCF